MFNDIKDDISNNVKKLQELRSSYPEAQVEIEVRIMKYGARDVSQTDFLRFRTEFDGVVKSQRSEDLGEFWTVEEVRDNVFIHSVPENVVDAPDTISRFRVIRTDVPVVGGKTTSKQTNMRKISILNDVKGSATDKKENKKAASIRSTLYPFRIGFSLELQGVSFPSSVQSEYRDRDRKSYILNRGETKILQIDTTIVKENSNSQTKKTLYEIEIELLVDYDERSEADLIEITQRVLKSVNQTRILYTLEERTAMISTLNLSLNGWKNENAIQTRFVNKPEDLTWDHLKAGNPEGLFPQLITDKQNKEPAYTVTVKLDGLRMFVYFGPDGVYLFNPLAHVICKINDREIPELTGTVVDGELIIDENEELHNAKRYTMYLFDCLKIRILPEGVEKVVLEEKKVTKKKGKEPVVITRDPYLHDVRMNLHVVRRKGMVHTTKKCSESNVWDQVKLLIFTKKFYNITDRETFYAANIQALTKVEVRNPSGQELELMLGSDGLVFTYFGEYLPETGSRNRRWKPPHQLTIDFRVLMINDKSNPSNKVGIPAAYVQKRENEGRELKQIPFYGTVENRFDPTAIELENIVNGYSIKILEEQIAEFRYDTRRNVFIPLRLRFDKSQPNDIKTAIGTWKLILNPIQRGVMTGTILGARVLDLMRNFHNNFKRALLDIIHTEVKQPVYGALPPNVPKIERPLIMDIGSGGGGDVDKWRFAGKKGQGFNVVALEPQADRVQKLAERIKNSKMQDRVNILEVDARKTKSITKKLQTLYGNRKVDAVSMFHVLTFFYDNENSISQLLGTIKEALRPGGIFVTMALDGDLIHQQLGDAAQIKLPGIMIRRMSLGKDAHGHPLPTRKIKVQISTPKDESLASGQEEYLVDFNHLITQFEANGFELLDDRYLDTETVLNDSEMWWSQITRVVKFRYVGMDISKRESLDKLKDIIMRAKTQLYPLLNPDQSQEMNVSISVFSKYNLWTVGVMGDGSCFLHSILYAINARYRDMNASERSALVLNVRRDLASLFTRDVYEGLSGGTIAELGRDNNTFSYDVLKTGLLDYGHWFGLEFLQFVSNSFGINIHLIWWRENKLQIYKHADNKGTMFIKGRNSIILFWQGQNHFQPVGRKLSPDGDLGFLFFDNDGLIKLFET